MFVSRGKITTHTNIFVNACIVAKIQIDRQTGRQTGRQTNRQACIHTYIHTSYEYIFVCDVLYERHASITS